MGAQKLEFQGLGGGADGGEAGQGCLKKLASQENGATNKFKFF